MEKRNDSTNSNNSVSSKLKQHFREQKMNEMLEKQV